MYEFTDILFFEIIDASVPTLSEINFLLLRSLTLSFFIFVLINFRLKFLGYLIFKKAINLYIFPVSK